MCRVKCSSLVARSCKGLQAADQQAKQESGIACSANNLWGAGFLLNQGGKCL